MCPSVWAAVQPVIMETVICLVYFDCQWNPQIYHQVMRKRSLQPLTVPFITAVSHQKFGTEHLHIEKPCRQSRFLLIEICDQISFWLFRWSLSYGTEHTSQHVPVKCATAATRWWSVCYFLVFLLCYLNSLTVNLPFSALLFSFPCLLHPSLSSLPLFSIFESLCQYASSPVWWSHCVYPSVLFL